jgi:hypothetical protein
LVVGVAGVSRAHWSSASRGLAARVAAASARELAARVAAASARELALRAAASVSSA